MKSLTSSKWTFFCRNSTTSWSEIAPTGGIVTTWSRPWSTRGSRLSGTSGTGQTFRTRSVHGEGAFRRDRPGATTVIPRPSTHLPETVVR